ncbi:hypothetical protein [Burkholderia multivorans]|uniref:hypothetical protein n=1 Tax=Burkholderia multivorans TaxID=87883 RepID=UPI0007584157|nr:hypothetical protein [Burkholderia multivorans]KVT46702.1 hypothetical protein WK52_00090 [Burkholderia multivorans]
MTVALIDGDEAIYKATVIKVEETDWEAETVIDRPPTFKEAKARFEEIVGTWLEAVDADEYIVCLSPRGRGLFRRGIYAQYKGARGEKPEQYKPLEDWVFENERIQWYPGLEADDVMGVLSGPNTVICSNDKDMKTVPGRLYITGKQKLVTITETRADWQWMYQTLMGDSTDGFNGCLGCGPKTAEKVLDDCGAGLFGMAAAVHEQYLAPKKGKYKFVKQTTQDFRRMTALARILRPSDYNPNTGDVKYALPGFKDISFNAESIAK